MESDNLFIRPTTPSSNSFDSDSLSEESSSSSKSKHIKRKRNHGNWSPTSKSFNILPCEVSDWKRQHVERCLHIVYATDHITPSYREILKKVTLPANDLTDEQCKYVAFVNEHFTFNRPVNAFRIGQGYKVQEDLADIEKHINDLQESSEIGLRQWILSLKDFLCATIVFCNCLSDAGKDHENLYEGGFKEFASEFARLCYLRVQSCSKAHSVVWENLNGMRVTSEPDLRFFKFGFNHDISLTSVPVIEVKPNYDGSSDPPKKRYKGSPRQSSSSLSSACFSEESIQPIALALHDKVLGQHAGELLLDLHARHKNEDLSELDKQLFMPGMIINGTMVYFTLLQMSSKHYEKLRKNEDLGQEEKAMIYYTQGRDILWMEDRNSLIEDLLHLNNIELS